METDHHLLLIQKKAAEQIIFRWDSSEEDTTTTTSSIRRTTTGRMIFESSDRNEIDEYLQAVDQIQRSIESTTLTIHNNKAIQIAMARLEDEFRTILITNSIPIETDSLTDPIIMTSSSSNQLTSSISEDLGYHNTKEDNSSSFMERGESCTSTISSHRSMSSNIHEIDLIRSDCIYDLRSIAQRMITAGYFRECLQVYGSVRKSIVDSGFRNLGIEKLSIGDIQRLEWETLNTKIGKWIRAAKICVRVLFASEKRLCQQIFQDLETDDAGGDVNDACFIETVKGPVIQLLNFAEAISISRRSPEKLFKISDLHDAMLDLLPDVTAIFDSKSAESIRVQATEIVSRLAEAARGMLSEFENAVLREPSTVSVPGGTIHPLTRYVMNYISLISDYKQTLGELIVAKPATGSRYSDDLTTPDMDLTDHEGQSPLALHLIWIIVILQFNLEGKSKHYKDIALSQLFIMNNVHYIVQKIKGSPELREMIGDSYLKKLTGKYRQAATRYQRATWVGVLYCLRHEGLHVSGSFSSGVSRSVLRERFKAFNAMFDEVHRMQALWLIPDTQLREELQISISEKLIPAYRSFLGRFRSHIENGRHPENYIKYSVEDLETAVLDFFEGYAVNQHSRRRSQ